MPIKERWCTKKDKTNNRSKNVTIKEMEVWYKGTDRREIIRIENLLLEGRRCGVCIATDRNKSNKSNKSKNVLQVGTMFDI